ncbi:MAG TPA: folylpolyglutamate synthase/dihydrofolate synthase family protein [Flavobacterium sp.]
MTYKETTEWMFSRLPMYQAQGASAYRKDLTNTILLCSHLGNPEKNLKFIHVAGTNGKGSTSHMLASIFMDAGYKTGLFTSPHLLDFRERIKVNGKEISESYVVQFIKRQKDFFDVRDMSFFEMTVGLAFDYFLHERVDIVILETGLGGRLDSTNVVTPELSIITNIGLDHTAFLGDTLEAIAGEKAGIIKPSVPVVIGEYTSETKNVFEEKAALCDSPIYFAEDFTGEIFPSDLKGDYQQKNIRTVLQSIDVLQKKGFIVNIENIKSGLMNVVKNTGLQGRWQQLREHPKVVCDTAHNGHGLELVMQQVQEEKYEQLHMVFGMVNDKNPDDIFPLLPADAQYYFCRPDIPRGMDTTVLLEKTTAYGFVGNAYISVSEAYDAALTRAGKDDFIYIGGSTFVVAEILQKSIN